MFNGSIRELYNEYYLNQVINSSTCYPKGLLGPHLTDGGCLISAFQPGAKQMQLIEKKSGKSHDMIQVSDNGLFGVLLGSTLHIDYFFRIFPYYGDTYDTEDCYRFAEQISDQDGYLFAQGTNYEIYNALGAHETSVEDIPGTLFSVWAPNAIRVSVVGNFNNWDGRTHQMNRVQDVGIFELFVPYIFSGELYKFEIKTKEGLVALKTDPFGNFQQLRPETASVVTNLYNYQWNDYAWTENRKNSNLDNQPMSIYEVHLGSWKKGGENKDEFLNYREIAPMLADYVLDMGYTHIELMGISEHPFDGSWGYQVTGYYAPTSRFGTPEDFMYFIDHMHTKGISVLLDWVPAHFPKDAHGLGRFDGTCLFEHPDPRRGEHPQWGTYIFNYGKNEVKNFLIGSALFWVEKFHIDGLRVDAVASMLYLDYGKQDGEWLPNKYGGHENLEAIEFLKHLNSIMSKRNPGAMVIAEESTSWPYVTKPVDDGGMGFSYKWNMGWMNDFLSYISTDPLFRKGRHDQLTFSLVYTYSEKFVLVLSHDEVVYGKCSMINKMPGEGADKFSNLRAAYGFMFGHPGKKLLFMGQDFAQEKEWNDAKELDWQLLDEQEHQEMKMYMKDLLHFYRSSPALYSQDYNEDGFMWISKDDAENSQISFVRKTADGKNSLLFVCNFTPVAREGFVVGAPCGGFYKNVFCSDYKLYGGSGKFDNNKLKAKETPADGQPFSIALDIPPLSVTVFSYRHTQPPKNKATAQNE